MTHPFDAVMPITPRTDIVFVAGEGSWLIDKTGQRYLDFVQGWAVNTLGHSHPALVATLQQQAPRLISPSPAFYNAPMIELASRLVDNSVFDEVFFANSGAEANEGAIKLARKWGARHRGGAWKIVTIENGFHGRTLATMAASGKPGWDRLFEPKVPGFIKVPYNDLDAVARAIDEDTIAVMLEPIQGEAGVIPATGDFIQRLRQLTRDENLLLIFDEIQTGMGRTGPLFAYEGLDVEPDIMTLGKGLGGGVPLSALLTTRQVSCFEPGDEVGYRQDDRYHGANPWYVQETNQRAIIMKPVIQQHPEGCALACAAMLAGLSYFDIAAIAGEMDIRAGDKALYNSTEPMRRLLARLGVRAGPEEIPFDGWPGLPACALLATKWHPEAGGAWWHWVVFSREDGGPVVFDPDAGLANNRRHDFSAIAPKWFIEIKQASGESGGVHDIKLPERSP